MTDHDHLGDLPPLTEIIRTFDLRAQKSLGQNFLLDRGITDRIAAQAGDLTGTHVIEIGPGPGGLTRSLVSTRAAHVTAIEFDPRAVAALGSLVAAGGGRLTVLPADALHFDEETVMNEYPQNAIIANLPYNIASILLVKWLHLITRRPGLIQQMILMFQREVAERLVAAPGTAPYGRLSVITQYTCTPDIVMTLAPGAFHPAPKVHSSVVRLIPKVLGPDAPPIGVLERVVQQAFSQRRKMIKTSLKPYVRAVEQLGLDQTLRAEDLSVDDYVGLARIVHSSSL
jgi:16S rRNA (adenine1518-N6/adenine1519-N6)-dimethyltransferase